MTDKINPKDVDDVVSNSFLPDGYTLPEPTTGWMKYKRGDNKFRILDSAIVGQELWIDGNPLRKRKKEKFTPEELSKADVNKFTGKQRVPVEFWAFPVYNYESKQVQILEVTQVTIMRGIESYLEDEDYGKDPKKYDLVVVKYEDENGKTEYSVKPKPPKPMDEGVVKYYQDLGIKIDAMFRGEDPFKDLNHAIH